MSVRAAFNFPVVGQVRGEGGHGAAAEVKEAFAHLSMSIALGTLTAGWGRVFLKGCPRGPGCGMPPSTRCSSWQRGMTSLSSLRDGSGPRAGRMGKDQGRSNTASTWADGEVAPRCVHPRSRCWMLCSGAASEPRCARSWSNMVTHRLWLACSTSRGKPVSAGGLWLGAVSLVVTKIGDVADTQEYSGVLKLVGDERRSRQVAMRGIEALSLGQTT